jgi:dTDP-L-rhamnose 4-epimerase
MRVLLTGGAGFIGRHLARGLAGHELVAFDNLHPQVHLDPEQSRRDFPGRVVVGDVASSADWDHLSSAIGSVDLVVHLAAETGTGQSMYEIDRYERVNVEGTRLAGLHADRWDAPLVAMSSRAVYGNGRHECADHGTSYGDACCERSEPASSREADPHRPVSVYGETKSRGEAVLGGLGVPVTVIRPQNVIGHGQALHNPYTGVLAAFLARLREGRSLSIYGDGSQTRDFVHVSDLAQLIVWAGEHPGEPGEMRVLNCGSGVRTTLLELASYAAAGSPQGEAAVDHLDVKRAGDIDHACADLSRLRELGAPDPRWSTRDAVADFIRRSWELPGASSRSWDLALDELAARGLTSGSDG